MLQIYHDNGFKLFHCNPDKTAFDWKNQRRHLTVEAATQLQKTGEFIGAWIPPDIIVIDLNRHKSEPDGVKTFRDIKAKYNIDFDITSRTFCVQTNGGGYHIFLRAGEKHKFTNGNKADGISLFTDFTYVIAAGSPGYTVHPNVIDLIISDVPDNIKDWLFDTVSVKKIIPEKAKDFIPLALLSKILKKLDINEFTEQNKWIDFINACQVSFGYTEDVKIELLEWSRGFKGWTDDGIRTSLDMFTEHGNVTVSTFIKILREHGVSQYFIKKILSYNTSIELYENMRDDGHNLPFPEPDYEVISDSKEARELFITGGNSVAATLLGFAIQEHIIWCAADKNFFLFDGNKWSEYNDMFSIVYTVLIRLTKFMYAKKKGSDVDNENFIRLVKTINKTHWKRETINELQCREGVFHKKAMWDSEKLKETLTTLDSVIDFTNNHVIIRKGEREEFRKSFIEYKSDEIIKSGEPVKYNEFLSGLFHDKDTLFTARQASSMYISGNARKVFQVFHGEGDNGKSTWIEIIKELLGGKAHTYSTSIILNSRYGDDKLPPEAADFMGKYVLFGSEVEKGKKLSLGKIKNFTGDDTIGATPKYKDERIFRPTWQMILSVNDLPFFDGTDRAFINRLVVLPFDQTFVGSKEEKDVLIKKGFNPDSISFKIDSNVLKKEIRKEFPSIIMQKINDYIDLKKNYNGIIKQSGKCIIHKNTYISENNDVENFILEMCIVSPEGDLFETTEALTEAYKEYSGLHKTSSRFMALNLKKIRQEITDGMRVVSVLEKDPATGIRIEKKYRKRGLLNIRLKTISENEQDDLKVNLDKDHKDEIPF